MEQHPVSNLDLLYILRTENQKFTNVKNLVFKPDHVLSAWFLFLTFCHLVQKNLAQEGFLSKKETLKSSDFEENFLKIHPIYTIDCNRLPKIYQHSYKFLLSSQIWLIPLVDDWCAFITKSRKKNSATTRTVGSIKLNIIIA